MVSMVPFSLASSCLQMESCASGDAKHENRLSMGDLLQMPSDDFMSALSLNIFEDKFAEWERKLEQIRRKHNLLEPDRKFGAPSSILDSPQRSLGLFDGEGSYGNEQKMPFLPELVRRMAGRRLEEELKSKSPSTSTSRFYDESYMSPLQLDLNSPPQPSGSSSLGGPSPVELKIPSYKPIKSTFKNGLTTMVSPDSDDGVLLSPASGEMRTGRSGDTLKDMLAKSIVDKVRSRSSNGYFSNGQASPLAPHNSNYNIPLTVDPSHYPGKRRRLDGKSQDSPTKKSQEAVGADGTPLKKTRPKRGQYRKYNSQLLIEAVKAVQRGEMSVHRAGSYFGVPHSTLEYKVKERHLMRQKKSPTSKSGNSSSSSVGSSNGGSSAHGKSDSPPPCDSKASPASCSAGPPLPPAAVSPSLSAGRSSTDTPTSSSHPPKDDVDARDEEEATGSSTPGTSSPEPPQPSSSGPPSSAAPGPDALSASSMLAAHANAEMLMAAAHANNPAMMQLAHQAALSSLALGSHFPLLAAWGHPNGFLPMGLPDPTMMAAAAAAAGYPFPGAFPGVSTSASDLLKRLQQKVEHNTGIPDLLEPGEIPRPLNQSAASSSSPDPTQVAAQ